MATDVSSAENGGLSADRVSTVGSIPTAEPVSTAEPIATAGLYSSDPAAILPRPVAAQPGFVSPETQAKAEAAAHIAAQSLGAPNLTKELAQLLAASFAQSQMLPEGFQAGAQTITTKARVLTHQDGASSPIGVGTPTNAELASLSAIMAGTQTVRKPLPRFRDELATLNYTRMQAQAEQQSMAQQAPSVVTQAIVAPAAAAQPMPPQAAQVRQPPAPYQQHAVATFESHHDDEPMPIPSTWRE